MNEAWLVDVALPVPLRQVFSYKVPPGIDTSIIKPGHRVLVPFRAKLLHGITMSAAYPDKGDLKVKPRSLVVYEASRRLLSSEIHQLAEWIVRYYRAPVGEVIKMAMPPGMLSEKESRFRLTPAGKTHLAEREEDRILGLLEEKPLTKKAWETRAQAEIRPNQIRTWEDRGFLEIAVAGDAKESIPHASVYVLTEKGRTVNSESLGRAKAQRALLEWMRTKKAPHFTNKDLAEFNTNAPNLAKALLDKGFLCRERIPTFELERGQIVVPDEKIKVLTREQETALNAINTSLDQSDFEAFLLFGITGAGKTEVYLRAIQHCLDQGRQALMLVPEIGLTPLMERRIVDRFGDRLAILHSAVSAGRRSASWARVLSGKVDVVLGARSSIFAPLPKLGIVIVDEEHDQGYKQNDGIRYQARDLALVRAKQAGAVAVLGSATPSLESWRNQELDRMHLLTITKRATRAHLPKVEIVDLREEIKAQKKKPVLSLALEARMERELSQGRQVMILLNRRGYFGFLMCRKCGETVMCDQCEVSLTYHRTGHDLRCHYCGRSKPVPEDCPSCHQPASMMQFFGEGTQQIQEIIQKRFPEYRVDRLDRDRLSAKDAHHQILADFEANRTRILVGTQMIAKGHDFPNVTLVGIINADLGLRIPDFRAAEVVFQLITQVAGRSGRGEYPGSVVIQTYMPEHYSIVRAAAHDFPGFLEREARFREQLFYPPFTHMIAILITHADQDKASQGAIWMAAQLDRFRDRGGLTILGPAKAPIGRIKNAWRYQVVLKSENRKMLHHLADVVVEETVKRGALTRQNIIVDMDPYQFF